MTTDIHVKQAEPQTAERTRTGQYFRPHVDILETADELLLISDMPGVTSENIDINFEDGMLTLEGKAQQRYSSNTNFLLYEYGIGDFHRTFRVSEQIDSAKIHAEVSDGVLTVHLPKAQAAKPRKIAVNAGEQSGI
jgi:HSP20 family molecular chaperone IbpA